MQRTTKVLGRVSRILYIDWSYLSAVGLTAKFSDTHKLRKSGNSHFQGIRLMLSYTTACQATVGSTVTTQLLTYEYDNLIKLRMWHDRCSGADFEKARILLVSCMLYVSQNCLTYV